MNAKDAITNVLDMSDRITKSYLKDLTAADLLIRPVPGQNHIAWQLGHLLATERWIVEAIKPGVSPPLPPDFEEGHGREKFTVDDPSLYLSPEKYIALIDAQRVATKQVLADLDDAVLDDPAPEKMRQMSPTVGQALLMNGNHYMMHVGQYVTVRRKLGKPIAM
jgi:hypothetical protein